VDTEKSFTANLVVTGKFSKDIVSRLTRVLTNEMKVNVRSTRVKMLPDDSIPVSWAFSSTARFAWIGYEKITEIKEVQSVTRAGA